MEQFDELFIGCKYGDSRAIEQLEKQCSVCGRNWVRTYQWYMAFPEDEADTISIYQGCPKRHESNIHAGGFPNLYGTSVERIKEKLKEEGHIIFD